MEISREHKNLIEDMMAGIECSKQFECHSNEFESLPEIRIDSGGSLIKCLDERMNICEFAISFGKGRFCTCQIREFIFKKYGK
jgi:hypothetical protein